ncbi:hypothetical protein BGZ95_008269 [Linnemannia exigua]|uniref:Chromosome segregation in meiosis protein n=1 Tax=Linnemannia exigua TaxID=604196 RepID=A0AAD4DGF8_9FUNG|nr:hypothetical protein BGZ95_008269 [Linnemannia exigua]
MDDFPDDLQLDGAAFEPFDDYEAFADEMMEQAQRADMHEQQQQQQQLQQAQRSNTVAPTAHSSFSSSSSLSANRQEDLPAQRDYLAMLNAQTQQFDREVEQTRIQSQQRRTTGGSGSGAGTGAGAKGNYGAKGGAKKSGSGWNRPIGSTAGGGAAAGGGAPAEGDLAAVNVVKKRPKQIRLDAEKQGFPLLVQQGKRFKIREKYRTSAEKDSNSKKNLADLMMLYQTWAHNLFPKANFHDFITLAESKCKDKQIKATMNGWRDGYWDEQREKQYAINEVERAAKEAEDRMNGVWNEHAAALNGSGGQGSAEDMDQDPFLVTQKGDGQPSSSNWTLVAGSSSRKGKERLVDNPSAAMRLQRSDDEDEVDGHDDYELALSRMRDSMNLDSRSPVVQRTSSSSVASRQRLSGGVEAMDEDPQEQLSTRISGGDLGAARAGSILDDDEEDDDEAPLFTHRALQMIGGLSALEERQRAAAAEKESNIPGKKTPTRATLSSDEEDNIRPSGEVDPSPVKLSLGSEWGASSGSSLFGEFMNAGKGGAAASLSLNYGGGDDEEDEEAVVTQRRPKARKAIILEDSDDE